MTTYVAIADGEIQVDKPVTQILLTKIRDNPLAIQEGDASAPKIALPAITAALTAGILEKTYATISSHALMRQRNSSAALAANATFAGSDLQPSNTAGEALGSFSSGTWRCLGQTSGGNNALSTTLFMRIA